MKKTAKSVKIFSNKIIKNKKGDIIKFLSKNDKFFKGFGDIYFSEIKKNKFKGWNFHKKNTCTIIAPKGSINFKIFEPQKKRMLKITIGKNSNNKIIQIPPGHWFSFTTKSENAIIANLMSAPHKKNETIKKNTINGIVIK
jgi:dTDP-4-dehydrorhamnose 3,5-epimerase